MPLYDISSSGAVILPIVQTDPVSPVVGECWAYKNVNDITFAASPHGFPIFNIENTYEIHVNTLDGIKEVKLV